MLEAGAFPVLLAGGCCAALRADGLLDVGDDLAALAAAAGAAGWRSPDGAWRALQALPRLREAALLVLLACPGAPARSARPRPPPLRLTLRDLAGRARVQARVRKHCLFVSPCATSPGAPARQLRACTLPATLLGAERHGRSLVASSGPTPVAEQCMSAGQSLSYPCSTHAPPTRLVRVRRGGHSAGRRGRAARPAGRDAAAAGAP
jgi:hypothetical protein